MKKILAAGLACLLLLAGCSKEPAHETTAPTTQPQATETQPQTEPQRQQETQPVTEPAAQDVNPLTGEALAAPYDGSRPYAVMINNVKAAQPQCGTSQADIMYEVLAEGGVTRMMAIFSDLAGDTPVGTIRSLRPYYLSIARSYDAVVVHAGGSPGAYSDLEATGWDHIDGVNGPNSGSYYYRDQWRMENRGYEHSMLIRMDDAVAYAQERECRAQHEDYQYNLTFTDQPLTQGEAAQDVTVYFRTGKSTSFAYDAETGLYAGSQYGEAWADGNDGTVLTFRNILVLHAATQTIDDEGRLAITLTGSGDGYLIRDGKCIPIQWSRESEAAPFVYTLADGSPVSLGVGKSYVAITPPESDLELS